MDFTDEGSALKVARSAFDLEILDHEHGVSFAEERPIAVARFNGGVARADFFFEHREHGLKPGVGFLRIGKPAIGDGAEIFKNKSAQELTSFFDDALEAIWGALGSECTRGLGVRTWIGVGDDRGEEFFELWVRVQGGIQSIVKYRLEAIKKVRR